MVEERRFTFEVRASIPAKTRREAVEKLKLLLPLIVRRLEGDG